MYLQILIYVMKKEYKVCKFKRTISYYGIIFGMVRVPKNITPKIFNQNENYIRTMIRGLMKHADDDDILCKNPVILVYDFFYNRKRKGLGTFYSEIFNLETHTLNQFHYYESDILLWDDEEYYISLNVDKIIEHIKQNQEFLNKLCGTGTIARILWSLYWLKYEM